MYECPKCGSDDLAVQAVERKQVCINGDGDVLDDKDGDLEFEGPYWCIECGHIGPDFWREGE